MIRHRRIDCISCAYCIENAPAYWRMGEDGMAMLVSTERSRGAFTFTTRFPDDAAALEDVEAACPANVITLE